MRASRKRWSMGESELKKGGQCVHAPPSPICRECPPPGISYPVFYLPGTPKSGKSESESDSWKQEKKLLIMKIIVKEPGDTLCEKIQW